MTHSRYNDSELEPISWPIKIAAAFALPIASIFMIALPLALYYTYDYSQLSNTTGQIIAFNNNNDVCVAETHYVVDGTSYLNYGDCINKEIGQTLSVRYLEENPVQSTTKSASFAYWFLPLFGTMLSLFGFYILYSCFSIYKRFIWRKKLKKMQEEQALNKDFLEDDYNEEDWYAEQETTTKMDKR